ncbi:MAG TPA: hypothetical protein VIL77_14300 [Gaiellaceae bacterium]
MTRGLALLTTLLATLAVALPAAAAEGRTLKGVLVSVSSTGVAVKDSKSVVTRCAVVDKSPSLDGYAAGDRVQAACVRTGGKLVLAKIRRLAAKSGSTSNDAEPTKFAGAVTALSDGSISLHDGDRDLTCSIGASSPSTAGVKVGQHVKVSCSNGALVAIAPVTSTDAGRAYEGSVSAVSSTSITVHTAKGDGTCTVGDGSPSLADVKVGDRVLAGCKAGTNQLVLLKKLAATGGDTPKGQTGAGTISVLSTSSVTFHNAERDVTCSLSAASPRLGDYNVGDKVKFGCLNGVLAVIAKDGSSTVSGAHKTVGAAGTVSAVSAGSLTVHTDGGDVTCSVGDGSPSVADVHVGDKVKIGCVDGLLKVLARSESAPPPGDGHTTTTVAGTLTALSSSSLTVHGEHGDVSCTVSATARLGDFHVGDRVGMACVDGALLKLVKL